MKVRIEVCKTLEEAKTQAMLLKATGFDQVSEPENFSVLWVNDPKDGPLLTYSDPADSEAWLVIARKT